MNANEVWKCCICGEYFTGWGNNPWPISDKEEDRCCDMCDTTKVLPARIAMSIERRKEKAK